MATPWERMSEGFRTYLMTRGFSADDYNDPSFDHSGKLNDYILLLRQQEATRNRGTKRPRVEETEEDKVEALKTLVELQKYDDAWANFAEIVKTYKGNGEENDDQKCNPIKVQSTWQGGGPENLTRLLVEQCAKIDRNINPQVRKELMMESGQVIDPVDDKADYRAGRIVGVRLGSGCGKSHLLLEAPTLLGRPGIYVTYNLDQSLDVDRKHPRETISLRILLRLAEVPHAQCYQFLHSPFGKALASVQVDLLRNFAVHRLSKHCGGSPSIFVGVDEIMALGKEYLEDGKRRIDIGIVRQVLSELGLVAKACAKSTTKLCHIFVTSLNEAPFYNPRGIPVIPWTPLAPDESAVEFILQPYLRARKLEKVKPLLIAAAGFHFRSIVFAARSLGAFDTPSVQGILGKVYARWNERVSDSVITKIKNFIVADCKGIDTSKGEVEDYLDHRQAVPPALICGAFGVMKEVDGNYEANLNHPLFNLFNCEFAYVDDAKQLEQFGESYDFFRERLGLPVLSAKVSIYFSNTTTTQRQMKWFEELIYPSGLRRSTDSLFEWDGKSKATVLSQAGKFPSPQNYYSPGKSTHPFVDRAFLAIHPSDNEQCFVLIQDKVNHDVPLAVAGLNKAGALLKAQHSKVEVLCILNVIGAGSRIRAQEGLHFPYVLVRDSELETFYTNHFTPVARFIRQRHEIGYNIRKEKAEQLHGATQAEVVAPAAVSQASVSMLDDLKAFNIGDEPKNGTRIQFRWPHGNRVIRKFDSSKTVKHVYAYVAQSIPEGKNGQSFVLKAGFPPKDLIGEIENSIEASTLAGESILIRWK